LMNYIGTTQQCIKAREGSKLNNPVGMEESFENTCG